MIGRRAFIGGGFAVTGDGLVRPLNAPPGGQPMLGVQPGVSQAVVIANKVIVSGPGGGIFVYSGTPAAGNLVLADVAANTTDPYGNQVFAGLNVLSPFTAGQARLFNVAGGPGQNTGIIWYYSTVGQRAWQQGAAIAPQVATQLAMFTDILSILPATAGVLPAFTGKVSINGAIFVPPSGDTTGSTDTAAITQALNQGFCTLAAGPTPYYANGIALPSNSVLDGGGATIRPGSGTAANTSMLTLAASTTVNTTVRDVILLDNYTITGLNGVSYTTSTSVPNNVLRHVTARGFNGYGFHFGATAGSASAHLSDCVAFGNFGDGFQLTSDQLVVNCEAGFNMGHGFHLLTGASNIYLANCLAWYSGVNPQTSVWPASGTSCGYFLEAPTQYSHLVGCHAQQNGLHGYALGATSGTAGFCYQVSVAGCGADTNSAYGAGGVGSGMFVSGVQSCVVTGFAGGNNAGLTPGSQLWGIQAPGGLVQTLFTGNTAVGTAGRSQIASRWVNMTLLNGWTNQAGFAVARYQLTDSPPNSVEIIGAINGAAATSAVFATLPAGFVPANQNGFATGASGGAVAGSVPEIRCAAVSGNLTVSDAAAFPVASVFIFHGFISLDA